MTTPMIHQTMPVLHLGTPLSQAQSVMILVHGRGAGAGSVIPIANQVQSEGWAYLVPQAVDATWYPQRFLVPRRSNEPYLSSALATLGQVVDKALAFAPLERVMLLGFSQGACLTLDYVARHPRRYGGVVALSGGLIGADEELMGYTGSLEDTPIFLGCSDVDAHIPLERVQRSADILGQMGGQVDVAHLPQHGSHHQRGRDGGGAGHDSGCGYEVSTEGRKPLFYGLIGLACPCSFLGWPVLQSVHVLLIPHDGMKEKSSCKPTCAGAIRLPRNWNGHATKLIPCWTWPST